MDLFDIAIARKLSGGGGGGGGSSASKKQINFVDYDGTIVDSYTASEWANVTSLPENPSHDGLTSQGWNWTKAEIDAQLTELPSGDVWVGQMYVTESGDTEIDVCFVDSARLSPYFSCAVNGKITIDWGDGTTSTISGTSLTSRQNAQHTYASVGDYTITVHVDSGSWAFYASSTLALLNKNSNTTDANRVYASYVRRVCVGNSTYIGDYAFNLCASLESITIPNSVTSIGINAFNNCTSLRSIMIPSGVTNIKNSAFSMCYALGSISIPSSVTSIEDNAFRYCTSLRSIMIPSGITNIKSNAFSMCYALGSISIPSSVTNIGDSAFNSCYGVGAYHIKPTTPPTLASTAVFKNIQPDCVMYVPSESLEAYKTASNWSTYASRMVGE